MRKLNLIVIFNKDLSKILFCIRAKEPYKGLYNFVGGKVENGESNDEAAYRELFEETGISCNDIELEHFMDLNYFKIVIGFGIYIISSAMTIGILYIAGLLNSDIMSLFNNIDVSSNALKSMMLIGILVYAVYNLEIYFIGNKLLNKGVNVD